jgi:flavin reductase (DIM6/NTAB) family NADH-FMN oxidoreductase RutF/rubredoxin
MIDFEALYKITYGLFIVSSGDTTKGNGFISNTVFQVSSEPPLFAVACNKKNFTAGLITQKQAFSVSVLEQETSSDILGRFGFKSGRDFDKLGSMSVIYGETGVPVVLNAAIAYFECKVINTVETGTHFLFIGELVQSVLLDKSKDPLTYLYYRQVKKGTSPANAPTFLDKSKLSQIKAGGGFKSYRCVVCGYEYDEEKEGVLFADLPDSWVCPVCGSEKSEFLVV